eukprot:2127656-Prymnesium_polylepis.1
MEAALEDLVLLSESSVFVGTASSHFSAVAAGMRYAKGQAANAPPLFADEARVASGEYAVGLLHSANLHRSATAVDKSRRWREATRRFVESVPAFAWLTGASGDGAGMAALTRGSARKVSSGSAVLSPEVGDELQACLARLPSKERSLYWRHEPGPGPHVAPALFDCVHTAFTASMTM